MAKIVVTGGAGFIGSHIVEGLLDAGHAPLVIDNLSSGQKQNIPASVPLYQLDIRSSEARALLERERAEVVVHAAAQMSVSESMKDPHFDVQVNVGGLVNLLQCMGPAYKPHFVFLSTGGALYGEQTTFPAPEQHVIQPTNVYGLSKHVGEMYLDFWARTFGLPVTALRLANVYGPRQSPHGEAGVVAIFSEKMLKGMPPTIFGDGKATRDFIFVGDVVTAVLMVLTKRVSGTFNIGTGKESTVNQVTAQLRSSLGSQVEAVYAPARLGDQIRSVIDATRANQTFGWKPKVDLAEGLQLTAEWFRNRSLGK